MHHDVVFVEHNLKIIVCANGYKMDTVIKVVNIILIYWPIRSSMVKGRGYRYISQMGETFNQDMRESFTYSISIFSSVNTQLQQK